MSVRERDEEDRQNSNCPSRGFGIAAAAMGVGVGAALYCFFSKRPENPDVQGAATSGWSCEQPQVFYHYEHSEEESELYSTISEHSTTDTSINESNSDHNESNSDHNESSSDHNESSDNNESYDNNGSTDNEIYSDNRENSFESDFDTSMESENSVTEFNDSNEDLVEEIASVISVANNSIVSLQTAIDANANSDSDITEWDVTNSSMGVPGEDDLSRSPLLSMFNNLRTFVNPRRRNRRLTEYEQMTAVRDKAYRERRWSVEECSICFEIMLRDQELMALPCTHNFHTACILPWLQERQTCPNCRKTA